MQLLEGLLNRVSASKLEAPGPNEQQLEAIMQAALRAPDHGNLKPWRSVMVSGEGRHQLGELFKQAQLQRNPQSDAQTLEKCSKMPTRAPNVLVLIASPKEHPKVPASEQIQSAAAAGHAMLLAAFAQSIGAVWRTGWVVSHGLIRNAFNLQEQEQIIAMIYMGTPSIPLKPVPKISSQEFIKQWH
ncbi:MAG: nitroreductase family protein [Gammaproteobacteria bacterium]|nr:nitroreductase family protein [Gammaproteobacteria bacterium]